MLRPDGTSDHDVRCPVCGAHGANHLARLSGGALRRCRDCQHAFLEIESSETIELQYNDHYAGFKQDPVFRREATRVLAEDVKPRLAPPARVLDVGCGNGEFLGIARDSGYEVFGIDVSEAAGDLCRRGGFDVRIGDLRATDRFEPDERFDLVTFWDVIEHLPDPGSFLSRSYELLNPGGYLLIKTPRTSTASVRVTAAVPRVAGALLQAPSHIQFFQREAVTQMLRKAGFTRQYWLASRPMRATSSGGRLRRRLARRAVRTFQRAVRDDNLLVIAQRN